MKRNVGVDTKWVASWVFLLVYFLFDFAGVCVSISLQSFTSFLGKYWICVSFNLWLALIGIL